MAEESKEPERSSFISELSIESIISAPLVAVSKANFYMLSGQVKFLLDYCFQPRPGNSTHEPIMIKMLMSRATIDDTKEPGTPGHINRSEVLFNVPMLCLVPLNSLAIDKVSVDFEMEITSATSWQSASKSYESDNTIIQKSAQLNGRICNKKEGTQDNTNSRHSTSTLKVGIHAGPLPLPQGVLTIMDLYTKSIQPVSASEHNS